MVFFYLVTHFITWMHFHYVWDFSLGISHIRLYHIVFSSLAAVESIADALVWLSLLLLCSSNDVTYAGASPLQSFNCCGKCCWWSSWAIVWGTKRLCYLPAFVKGVWGPLEGSWDLCAGLNEGRKPFIEGAQRPLCRLKWRAQALHNSTHKILCYGYLSPIYQGIFLFLRLHYLLVQAMKYSASMKMLAHCI